MYLLIHIWPIFCLSVWKISTQSSFSIELCTQLMVRENRGLLTKTKSMSWHYFLQASFSRNALSSGEHYSQKAFWKWVGEHPPSSVILVKYQQCFWEGCARSMAKGLTLPSKGQHNICIFLFSSLSNKEQFKWAKTWTEPGPSLQLNYMHTKKRGQNPLWAK